LSLPAGALLEDCADEEDLLSPELDEPALEEDAAELPADEEEADDEALSEDESSEEDDDFCSSFALEPGSSFADEEDSSALDASRPLSGIHLPEKQK
jgi:hypothetical protein